MVMIRVMVIVMVMVIAMVMVMVMVMVLLFNTAALQRCRVRVSPRMQRLIDKVIVNIFYGYE